MNETTAERMEILETRLAYLERANQELSDVLFAQQRTLDALAARVIRLASRIEAVETSAPASPGGEERPPHY